MAEIAQDELTEQTELAGFHCTGQDGSIGKDLPMATLIQGLTATEEEALAETETAAFITPATLGAAMDARFDLSEPGFVIITIGAVQFKLAGSVV